jgi:deoxyribodipyrimidine photo-lyase
MVTIFWFRRDLRLLDNAGLYHALKKHQNVQPIFIFDKSILEKLENKSDSRVEFIHRHVEELQKQLSPFESNILTFYGEPLEVFKELLSKFNLEAVYANHDYEPYALNRDSEVTQLLQNKGIKFETFKDQCIFEKNEVIKDDGKPYTVFSPYMRKWKTKLSPFFIKEYPTQKYFQNFNKSESKRIHTLAEIGFEPIDFVFPVSSVNELTVSKYSDQRDFPGIKEGTSKISVHLRFGTVSIRTLVNRGQELNEKWLNELIWRDFYMMILWHFPHVIGNSFKPQYDAIEWRNNESEFRNWCSGNTGFPIVDAGMRELNETGFMHNRVRMVVASFLTKHLLIDWRWGEAYFASKLNDFDLSANNGGWQWAAGSGCDAAPYFRIFNPYEQTKKFDPKYEYIKNWVPEYLSSKYPKPIVDHKLARERCLATYKKALNQNKIKTEQIELF